MGESFLVPVLSSSALNLACSCKLPILLCFDFLLCSSSATTANVGAAIRPAVPEI